ncbi:cytochrome P450 [Actinomycetes bacterium KLBMP 9797]
MELKPFTGAYLVHPAVIWRALLGSPDRVHYAEDLGMWVIPRHGDVRDAFGDNDNFLNAMTLAPVYEMAPEALPIVMQIDAPPTTAAADPPTHPRTRRALRATFPNTTARVEEQFGPIVRRRTKQLVERLVARRDAEIDLISAFAAELPLLVVADILGAPESDIPQIKRWSDGQIALIWGRPSPAEQVRLAQGLLDFWRYTKDLVARSDQRGDDYVSRALRYRNGDDSVLTEAEVASLAFNLLVAGHETTAGLLAHCFDYALTVPQRWDEIVTDPATIPGYVEETLRFGPAIDGWLRMTSRDVTIGEVTIPAGARCLLLVGAANRDPAVFEAPDQFDPHRRDARDHLSFGYGPHFCIGAALARLEAQTALAELAAALPGLRLAPGHIRSYKPNVAFRAHQELPVITAAAIEEERVAA